MAFLNKGKKIDLCTLGLELGLNVTSDDKIVDLREKITKCKFFTDDIEFVKDTFSTIVEDRLKQEDEKRLQKEDADRVHAAKQLADQRAFELEKLKLQSENRDLATITSTQGVGNHMRIDLKNILPVFSPEKDDMSLFLTMFERQMKMLNIHSDFWVSHLIGVLPNEICKLVAREDEAVFKDYSHIRNILLQRFKLTAERFRILFGRHQKRNTGTWKDFYFELRTYFEGWLNELEITSFDKLKELIIADQIKKKCPPDYKNHYLDGWEKLNDPVLLAEKFDMYENVRSNRVPKTCQLSKNPYAVSLNQEFKKKEFSKFENRVNFKNKESASPDMKILSRKGNRTEDRPISCYGCGKQGFIRAKCPNCSPQGATEAGNFHNLKLYSCSAEKSPTSVLKIKVNGKVGFVCADTGASHTVAGETLYHLLRDDGMKFEKMTMNVSLADGCGKETEVLKTEVDVEIEGRLSRTTFLVFPHAKGNRTLLGVDFLKQTGVVLDIRNHCWYFSDNPEHRIKFAEDTFQSLSDPLNNCSEVNMASLKENEGNNLTCDQKSKLDSLLHEFSDIFEPGEEATPMVKHYIDTGSNPPVAVPPYRMSPIKKELLKGKLDELLANRTIEECESPYASPVVLVPKPDGQMRLCVDYRKLNSLTKTDKYPLPRIDDLLHEAKHTPFMSTIDLKNGYHQIEVNPADRDKTAFTCPFGTFRYLKMPFGLKNAPATFQRMIDNFRNSLKNVLVLSYLDDIIILSETFDEHVENLRAVFRKLREFKLHANREKCNFACNRVKYLGHYITSKGLEADPDKTTAIQEMPIPNSVKQVQSFLQTCSWYRRFIPNFSEIARPLTNLTKKKVSWNWGEEQEKSFKTLKHLLISSPILSQNDPTKPYILRTDASNYALGAVLLQGSAAEEHPIEYASRLLTKAERNYSTTEKEALAIVWALNKFRAYIDGQEVTVATDHQPLRWLMTLKSPTGRLARWALQVQSFNLKIEYVPGKANVVADMLSRPFCQHKEEKCEICTVTIDIPARSPKEIRDEQLKDEDVRKIIESLESVVKDEDFANWSDRGYLMNQGMLYRYSPEADSEEAQLVVPFQERERVLKEHHDAPSAGHYGIEGTFDRIAKRYYWTGMRRYITEYVKNCTDCCRYKPSNQKPSGLLQTPIYGQRFESLAIDLFGPLPKSNEKRWIFIVEDCATKWVELFPLECATAKECAVTLIEEVFLRYGLPRRIISDNGSQFVSAIMQQVCFILKISQTLTPVYHPQANPVERKNRDMKPRLAILVGDNHTEWSEKLPVIRFALNTARCDSTGHTAAYLMFGRELRTTDDVEHDFRSIVANDNFVPEITPYLKEFANYTKQVRDRLEAKQDQRKFYADQKLRKAHQFKQGDKVWVTTHPQSQKKLNRTSKFMPRRDGPYLILSQRSPTSYTISSVNNPSSPIGNYHVSSLRRYESQNNAPLNPIRSRGRPKTTPGASKPPEIRKRTPRFQTSAVPTRKQPPRKASCRSRTTYTA